MFALEGTALNAALLAAAAKFHGRRTTANARLVFRATLLYLPLVLFFFVLHSTRLKDEGDADARAPPTLGDAVRPLRDLGRALCLHELLPRDEAPSAVVPPLCPVGPKKKTTGADDAIK